ncbi:MAG: hypothetical protein R3C68_06335 [Myxococcota bacterium]
MFENLIREMRTLERDGLQVRVPIQADERGYVDRECPAEGCLFQFKVHDDDWTELFRDEAVYCPQCRHEATSDSWWTTEQIEHARETAMAQLEAKIDGALRTGARRFNSRQPRKSFIKMSMHVKGPRRTPVVVPAAAAEVMEQQIQCEECSARFAVVGIAYFCPCCGHNSAARSFDGSITKIRTKVDNLDTIRHALESAGLTNEAEATCRSLLESCVQDCVVAYQRLADVLFGSVSNTATPMNAFQRLQQGSDLWQQATGHSYSEWLSPAELDRLHVHFQRRHLLAHRDGVVDNEYLRRSNDSAVVVGQRIVVTKADVLEVTELIIKLAEGIRSLAKKED